MARTLPVVTGVSSLVLAVSVTATGGSLTLITVRSNGGSDAEAPAESVTVITIPLVVPTSALPGVPLSLPVAGSNVAHDGLLVMLKVSVSPASRSDAVGVKLYAVSSATEVGGVPEMVGGSLTLVTVRSNGGSDAETPAESVTVITIPVVVPTSALRGVPLNTPVAALKPAHDGLLAMLKVSVSPGSTSEAVGAKLYAVSSATLVDGTPAIVGGSLTGMMVMFTVAVASPPAPSVIR